MSRKDGAVIACRVLAVYFLCWALDLVSYLPDQILSVYHYSGPGGAYLFWHYTVLLIAAVLRIVAFACLSGWFYRHPPDLQNLFLPAEEAVKVE